MTLPIERDTRRFQQIVRGHVRQNLRKYIANGELIGRQGRDLVSIPVPGIELPHFRFGDPQGGVGQGDGEIGTPIGAAPQQGNGEGGAGDQPGAHIMEVEMSLSELTALLGEELELPRIEPKNRRNVEGQIMRYTGLRRIGPESLRHFKHTYRQALKRQLAQGIYNPDEPAIIPIRDDKRYRSWKVYPRPDNNAVVIYMMDVSGSMTQGKKRLVRLTAFWIDSWLRTHYKNLEMRYIVHDAVAHEVDAHTFYSIRESGGTRISSAYDMCAKLIEKHYNPADWNLYGMHFSDGENFGDEDDQRCLNLLKDKILPGVNLFCYGQVRSAPGHQFLNTLTDIAEEKLATAQINDEDHILDAIKTFLGKGY